jgi:hypothetical protein
MAKVVIDMTMLLLEKVTAADGPLATHVRYRVVKE